MIRRLLARALDNWPPKLGALLLAALLWWFVATNDTGTTQRTLLVPITVEGVGAERVAVGLPETVAVDVTGDSVRVDRLRPESIEAVLDLSRVEGEFQEEIAVQPPRGVTLLRVNPSEVIGSIASLTSASVPLEAVFVGGADASAGIPAGATAGDPGDNGGAPDGSGSTVFHAVVEPAVVTVRGRRELVEEVERALVAVPAAAGVHRVRPFALDAANSPLRELQVTPDSVSVSVSGEARLGRKRVPVELAPSSDPALALAGLAPDTVTLLGPVSQLAAIERVQARVELPTRTLPPGRYTLPVRLELPDGVAATEVPSVTVELADAPTDE